jgi:hypothetical protein
MRRLDHALPDLMGALIDRALAAPCKCPHCGEIVNNGPGDREAAIYLLDRRLGRPRQEVDARISAQVSMAPDDYARLSLLQSAIGIVAHLAPAQEPIATGSQVGQPSPDTE